jgi:DNA polymerase V
MTKGGKRPNSGPKRSMSPFGEKTSVIRVPTSIKADVLVYLDAFKKDRANQKLPPLDVLKAAPNPALLPRPLYSGKVSAGQSRFPSPAQDYEQEFLDLNKEYSPNIASTYYFNVKGNSMEGAFIPDGARVAVDTSVKPKSSNIVVAAVDGEWMVKRFYKRGNVVKLLSEHPDHAPIEFSEGQELMIFGVVTGVFTFPK